MTPKPRQSFRVMARLLHDAAASRGEEIADELANHIWNIHNNYVPGRPLTEMISPKYSWVLYELSNGRSAWNRKHKLQPFPDLTDPINLALFQELAEAIQGVDRETVMKRIENREGREGRR